MISSNNINLKEKAELAENEVFDQRSFNVLKSTTVFSNLFKVFNSL